MAERDLFDPTDVLPSDAQMHEAITAAGETKAAHNRINWPMSEEGVLHDVAYGAVTQMALLESELGGFVVPIINFTETEITETDYDDIVDSTARFANATGGRSLCAMSAICLLSEESMEGMIGMARQSTGVIRLTERLLLKSDNYFKGNPDRSHLGLPSLKETMTHEQNHLIELRAPKEHRFNNRLGYFGSVPLENEPPQPRTPSPSTEQYAFHNGDYVKVYGPRYFGPSAFKGDLPVTEYSKKSWREDGSDSAVDFLYDAEIPAQDRKLGPVRRSVVKNVFTEVSSSLYGPFNITLQQVEPTREAYNRVLEAQVNTVE